MSETKYYKITNTEENHHGYQYVDGLNVLKEPFSEEGSCVPGGFYFTTIEYINEFFDYGIYLREITLPTTDSNFKMVRDGNKWRANKIILGKRYNLSEVSTWEYLFSLGMKINEDILLDIPKKGYLEVAKLLIEKGADVHAEDDFALRWASRKGHLEVVKLLIEKGADLPCP